LLLHPAFSGLPLAEQSRFNVFCKRVSLQVGHEILAVGSTYTDMYVLDTGTLRVDVPALTPSGFVPAGYLSRKYDLAAEPPEAAEFCQFTSTMRVTVVAPATVFVVPIKVVLELAGRYPSIGIVFARQYIELNQRLYRYIAQLNSTVDNQSKGPEKPYIKDYPV
jgi:hypothetical protein